jgi:hypothetical protein
MSKIGHHSRRPSQIQQGTETIQKYRAVFILVSRSSQISYCMYFIQKNGYVSTSCKYIINISLLTPCVCLNEIIAVQNKQNNMLYTIKHYNTVVS